MIPVPTMSCQRQRAESNAKIFRPRETFRPKTIGRKQLLVQHPPSRPNDRTNPHALSRKPLPAKAPADSPGPDKLPPYQPLPSPLARLSLICNLWPGI